MSDEKAVDLSKPLGARPYKRRVRNVLIHKPMQRECTFVIVTLLMVSSLAVTFIIHRTITGAISEGGFRFGHAPPRRPGWTTSARRAAVGRCRSAAKAR